MYFTKQLNQITTIFLVTLFSLFSISCSDDDGGDGSNSTNEDASSYDISIDGEGDFIRNNISLNDAPQISVSGIWYESPENDGELITASITDTGSNGITFSSSIVLLNGNPATVDSPLDFNDENPQTSLINIQANGVNYFSNSGSISLSNLELIPQEIPESPGDTAFANFNMSFTAEFDIAETTNVVENIEISGDLKILNPSF